MPGGTYLNEICGWLCSLSLRSSKANISVLDRKSHNWPRSLELGGEARSCWRKLLSGFCELGGLFRKWFIQKLKNLESIYFLAWLSKDELYFLRVNLGRHIPALCLQKVSGWGGGRGWGSRVILLTYVKRYPLPHMETWKKTEQSWTTQNKVQCSLSGFLHEGLFYLLPPDVPHWQKSSASLSKRQHWYPSPLSQWGDSSLQ